MVVGAEVSTVTSAYLDMTNINNGLLPTNDEVDATKNQLRIFLVAQARRELERVIKLTETLDKLENKFRNLKNYYICLKH